MIAMQGFIILAIISREKHTLVFYSGKVMTKSLECEMWVKGTRLRCVFVGYYYSVLLVSGVEYSVLLVSGVESTKHEM